jgi:hypothetical protein
VILSCVSAPISNLMPRILFQDRGRNKRALWFHATYLWTFWVQFPSGTIDASSQFLG